jgi:methylase of polypeptide subunit release factors
VPDLVTEGNSVANRHDLAAVASYTDTVEQAAATVGDALRSVGYSEDGVVGLLGDDAYSRGTEDMPVNERMLPRTKLATVVRAFFLLLPVATDDAVDALGRDAVDSLEAAGLAEVGDDVVPRARILPVDELYVAADGFSRDIDDPPDYVAAYSPTSRLLDSLTPRPQVERALDVGTGSGIHALRAATHARHVIATDVNPRALEFTRLNAALNGMTNIELRSGSLFEPVVGETFDLITCNAPYVVSPERRWVYRDAGGKGDEVSEQIVAEAAAHLLEGGFATMLVSWVAADEDDPDERVLAWTERSGCDSWILVAEESDPLGHAAGWNSHLAGDPEAFGAALDEWTRYLDELGVRWVSDGAVILKRRAGGRPTARVDSVDEDDVEDASEQIARAFDTRARLEELGRNDLLEATLSVAMPLRLEHELVPAPDAPVPVDAVAALATGTSSAVETTPDALEVLGLLDGETPLEDVVDEVAGLHELDDDELREFRRDVLDLCRELLELGALRLD